jgi:glutathione S-transferase
MSALTQPPTLIYWKIAARGQLPVLLLSAGSVDFVYDDATANAWPEEKEKMPFGQLPVLKIGDKMIAQSGAIVRYCAKIANLLPADDLEVATVDSIMEQCNDVFSAMVKAKYTEDDTKRKAAWKKFQHETLSQKMDRINTMLANTGEVFFGGKQPNAADVAIFSTLNLVEKAGVKLPQWSHLSVVYEKVATVGTIPEYIAQNLSAYVTME